MAKNTIKGSHSTGAHHDVEVPGKTPYRGADQTSVKSPEWTKASEGDRDMTDDATGKAPKRRADSDTRQPDPTRTSVPEMHYEEDQHMSKSQMVAELARKFADLSESELAEFYADVMYEGKDNDDDDDDDDDDKDDDGEGDSDDGDNVVTQKVPGDKGSKPDIKIRIKEGLEIEPHVNALMEGFTDLPEDFRKRIPVIFEAAIHANLEKLAIAEAAAYREATDNLVDLVDRYLDGHIAEWRDENKIAIESSLRIDIAENFLAGLHDLFRESHIIVPEEKLDVVEQIGAENEQLVADYNELAEHAVELAEELAEMKRREIVGESIAELSDTDAERIITLSESVEFESVDDFKNKMKTLVEAYVTTGDKKVITETTTQDGLATSKAQAPVTQDKTNAKVRIDERTNASFKKIFNGQ